jgi:glycosyltransferase involved in cell wall biosynthesis
LILLMSEKVMNPKVTVLMSVYNGEKYLRQAVDSILNQTFTDFEFIMVDDGSTDATKAILDSYTDPRIVRLTNETNIGLTASLNRGLKIARGTYIARMDADDISLPERLRRQVQFLDSHPDIGVLGTKFEVIDDLGRPHPRSAADSWPTQPGMVSWLLFFRCSIAHPTVMVRRAVYERLNGYNPEFLQAQDYELWLRAGLETGITNIPKVLVKLRSHPAKVSRTHSQAQNQNVDIAVQNALSTFLGRAVSLETVRSMRNWHNIVSAQEALQIARLLNQLYQAYTKSTKLSASEKRQIRADASRRLTEMALVCTKMDPRLSIRVWKMLIGIRPEHPIRWLGSILKRSASYVLRHSGLRTCEGCE